jgi:hypothetical protein
MTKETESMLGVVLARDEKLAGSIRADLLI